MLSAAAPARGACCGTTEEDCRARVCIIPGGARPRHDVLQHLWGYGVSLETLASGIDFLGWVHFPTHVVPRATTRRRMLQRVKNDATPEVLASYLGLLTHGNAFKLREAVKNAYWLWNA